MGYRLPEISLYFSLQLHMNLKLAQIKERNFHETGLIFYRTYNDSVTKQHRNITLHLGSSGISPKVCFCILQVHGLASLFTSSSFMFKTLPPCFYLGVASMSKVGDYIEIRHFFNVRTQIECALLQ